MRLIPIVLLIANAVVAQTAAAPRVSQLAWIAGSWCSASEKGTAEEYWTPPRGGVILGVHRDVSSSGRSFFEYLRIQEDGDEINYYASPAGRPATPFRLIDSNDSRAVFENSEHDFPQRIVYSVSGEHLHCRIEGEIDGELKSSEWRWKKDACDF